jgi:hypothetical protein
LSHTPVPIHSLFLSVLCWQHKEDDSCMGESNLNIL